MAFSVNDFRSQLIGDGARPNLFEVQLQFPSYVDLGNAAARKSTFLVKSAQLPGSTMGLVPMFYFGRESKLAGNRTFQDWTVQIINDEDFLIRNALEQWHAGLNDNTLNIRDPSADVVDGGYGADAIVRQYSKSGDIIKEYNMIGMWPIDISPIEVDWGANDTIEEFTATFALQYWVDASQPTNGLNFQIKF